MSRILAIDYGKKRTGVAVTDILQIIANGLTTVPTHQLMDFILKYVESEPVERIIVGHPKQMNNQESENMRNIVPVCLLYTSPLITITVWIFKLTVHYSADIFTFQVKHTNRGTAVSYTHLDVYKRQVLHRANAFIGTYM